MAALMFYESKFMFRNVMTTCDDVEAEVTKRLKFINENMGILAAFQSMVIRVKK